MSSLLMRGNRYLRFGLPAEFDDPMGVALTFDDGPDPDSTPILLRWLQEANVHATFFLTGERAYRYPTLTRDIRDAGHGVQSHGRNHVSPWRLSRKEWIDNVQSSRVLLEDLVEGEVRYYRPPYGRMRPGLARDVCEVAWCMWTLMPYEFDARMDAADVTRLLSRRLRGGDVVVLHDQPALLPVVLPALQLVQRKLEQNEWTTCMLGNGVRMANGERTA